MVAGTPAPVECPVLRSYLCRLNRAQTDAESSAALADGADQVAATARAAAIREAVLALRDVLRDCAP